MQPETKRAVMALLIAVIGVVGLAIAAGGETWRGYYGGLLLFIAMALLEFRLIKQHFDIRDGKRKELQLLPPLGWLVPDRTLDQWFMGLVAAGIGIYALIIAGRSELDTAGYDLGILVFVLCVLYVFALIKKGYDKIYGKL
jgi:FtsH-binding integral membrane protein